MSKFPNDQVERLYELSLDGSWRDGGNVEAPTGWYCLLIINSDPDKGNWVLHEDNQGFVDVTHFSSEKAAARYYDRLEAEYGKWANDD